MTKISHVLLVDDHPALRQALALILDQEPEFAVVGEAGTVAEAREMLRGVDIAIIDPDLPDGDGIDLIAELHRTNLRDGPYPGCKVLVLTASLDHKEAVRAVKAGATGVLHKAAPIAEIVDAMNSLRAGETLFSALEMDELKDFVIHRQEQNRADRQATRNLTPREREVLRALADGCDNKEIARRLGIALGTERNYMTSILAKLKANSQEQALVFAVRRGIVKIHSAPPDKQ